MKKKIPFLCKIDEIAIHDEFINLKLYSEDCFIKMVGKDFAEKLEGIDLSEYVCVKLEFDSIEQSQKMLKENVEKLEGEVLTAQSVFEKLENLKNERKNNEGKD